MFDLIVKIHQVLNLIKDFGSIDGLYEKLEKDESGLKGKLKEKLEENKELAYLSRTLGTIDTDAPIEKDLENLKVVDWNFEDVLSIFKELRFNRFIERFSLEQKVLGKIVTENKEDLFENKIIEKEELVSLISKIENDKKLYYYFETKNVNNENLIIKEDIKYINIYLKEENVVYTVLFDKEIFKSVFENIEV